MKRSDLIRRLRAEARASGTTFELVRQDGGHEVWSFGSVKVTIPRHREINELTARSIIRAATKEGRGS